MKDSGVRLNLRLRKEWLILKARRLGLLESGNKLDLAVRIAAEEEERFSKDWVAISGSTHES